MVGGVGGWQYSWQGAAGPRARARKGAGRHRRGRPAGAREEGADAAPNPLARPAGSGADCTGGGEDPPLANVVLGGVGQGGVEPAEAQRRDGRQPERCWGTPRSQPAPRELSGPQRTIR